MEVLYGLHPVEEAIRSGSRQLDHVTVARERRDDRLEQLIHLCRTAGIRVSLEPRDQLTRLARGRSTELGLIRRWLGQVNGRGGCRHPDGAVRMIGSALDVFTAEIAGHAHGTCEATSMEPLLPVPGRMRS